MTELIVLTYNSVHGAQAALTSVRALEDLDYAWVDDVAVIEKHKHGRVSLQTPHGSASGGAWTGALVGMLAFWWFPPAWFAAGAVGGAAVGAGFGELMKHAGVDESMIDGVKDRLENGTSALLLIGIDGNGDEMTRAFDATHPSETVRTPLDAQSIEHLKNALDNTDG